MQVCCAMAVAEHVLEFEHRDLHWGNILISKQPVRTSTSFWSRSILICFFQVRDVSFCIAGKDVAFSNRGVGVNIIDFTLSRLRVDGKTYFCDLAQDETLFQGEGDIQVHLLVA